MKYILSVFIFLFFGCSAKPNFIYVKEPVLNSAKKCNCSLAVKEIELPYYLEDAKVPYIKDGEIKFFDDTYFADNPQEFVTKRTVKILKNTLTNRVYIYPWNSQKIKYILSIDIQKCIAKGKLVSFTADWTLFDKNKNIIKSSTYHDSITIKNLSAKEVVFGMQKLFDRFINNTARKISGF